MNEKSTIKNIIEAADVQSAPENDMARNIKRESPMKLILIISLCVSIALLACAFAYISFAPSLKPSSDAEGKIYLTSDSAPWFSFENGVISLNPQYSEALPETLVIPDYFNDIPVKSIGEGSFSGKTEIKALKLGENVSVIGKKAFSGCSSLESASLPSVEDIENETFAECTSLTIVTAPKVKVVYTKAFYNCVSLDDFVSNSLVSIGQSAFENCAQLSGINTAKITKYGKRALAGCKNLPSVNIADGAKLSAECFEGSAMADITFLGDASLSKGIFKNCADLKKLYLPENVTEIPEEMFYGCASITDISLPESVTTIGNGAFAGCTGITSAVIHKNAVKLGNGIFEGCISLSAPEIKAPIEELPAGIFKGCTAIGYVTIPDTVTVIGDEAFSGCSNMQSTNLPFGVTTIGNKAYYGCSAFETISLPAGIVEIGENAFEGCTGAKSIVLPASVSVLGDGALKNCSSLESLGLYCDADGISGRLVEGCSSLKTISTSSFSTKYTTFGGALLSADKTEMIIFPAAIERGSYTLPSTVTSVAAYAFMGAQFAELDLSNTEMIGMSAFEGCENLMSVSGKKVSTIGYGAFRNCTALKTLDFTESLREINSEAFAGCSALLEVTLHKDVNISDTAFDENVTVVYPEEKE